MGLDLGIEKTGRFELLACVEIDHAACETMRLNVAAGRVSGNPTIIEADISKLTVEDFCKQTGINPGEIDLLIGGPPCQSFSTVGNRGTVQDPRGTLLWDFLRFVEGLRPSFFLMENVRGLLSAALKHRPIAKRPDKGGPPLEPDEQPGSVVRLFAADLQSVTGGPYHMDCFEVNAVNYGAPQLRERALFIGNRLGQQVDFPEPTHGVDARQPADLFSESAKLLPWRTLRDAIGDLDEQTPVIMDFSPRKKSFLALVPEGSNWRSLPVELQKESMGRAWHAKGGRSGWWRRLIFDLPCPTLVTMPNHASTALCHPTEVRALTLREYARIQEFPDAWEFTGKPAQQFAQVGNAVPVRLGEVAGKVIARGLDAARNGALPNRPPEAFRIVYLQSHIRTRQWFKNGKTFVWNDDEPEGARYAAPVTKRRQKSMVS
jgi:DNA (cytosine-5)-methyltransferase 1